MYYYVSMVLMWSYVYCSGVEEWCLPSTEVETINQSINQSIAINSVGDCSERTVLSLGSSLLVINQVLRIIKNAVKSDVKTGRI